MPGFTKVLVLLAAATFVLAAVGNLFTGAIFGVTPEGPLSGVHQPRASGDRDRSGARREVARRLTRLSDEADVHRVGCH